MEEEGDWSEGEGRWSEVGCMADGWVDGWMDGWVDELMDGWVGREKAHNLADTVR